MLTTVRTTLVLFAILIPAYSQGTNPTIQITRDTVAVQSPKDVLVTSRLPVENLDPTAVVIERLDASNAVIAAVGRMYDDGTNGDVTAGDGVFSRTLRMTARSTGRVVLRIRARYVLPSGVEHRFSPSDFVAIINTAVQNADWSAFNYLDTIELFIEPPEGAATVVLYRATNPAGPWTDTGRALRDKFYEDVDGRNVDYYFRAEALNAAGQVIKSYAVLKVPSGDEERVLTGADIEGVPPQSAPPQERKLEAIAARSTAASRTASCAINPNPGDRSFVSEEEFACWHCMSLQQIRTLFLQVESYFASVVPDTDGVPIDVPQLLYDNAVLREINPQILLAKFQGEQGLLKRDVRSSQRAMANAMGCGDVPAPAPTIRAQIECAARKLRLFFDQAANGGTTVGGWRVGSQRLTQEGEFGLANPREALPVTPANRAAVALYQYTPYRGYLWGGPTDRAHRTAGNGVLMSILRNSLKLIAFEGAIGMDGPDMELTHDVKTGQYTMVYKANYPDSSDGFNLTALLPPACAYSAEIQVYFSTTDRCRRYTLPDGTPTDAGMNECFSLSLLNQRYDFGAPVSFDNYTPLPTEAKIMAPWGGADVGPLVGRQQLFSGNYAATHIEQQHAGYDLRTANYLHVTLHGQAYETGNQYPSWGTAVIRKVKPIF
jgi:hypothetical protein